MDDRRSVPCRPLSPIGCPDSGSVLTGDDHAAPERASTMCCSPILAEQRPGRSLNRALSELCRCRARERRLPWNLLRRGSSSHGEGDRKLPTPVPLRTRCHKDVAAVRADDESDEERSGECTRGLIRLSTDAFGPHGTSVLDD